MQDTAISRPVVLVGVDGSDEGSKAVAWAADYAALSDGILELLIAWHWPPSYGYPMPIPGYDPELACRTVVEKAAAQGSLPRSNCVRLSSAARPRNGSLRPPRTPTCSSSAAAATAASAVCCSVRSADIACTTHTARSSSFDRRTSTASHRTDRDLSEHTCSENNRNERRESTCVPLRESDSSYMLRTSAMRSGLARSWRSGARTGSRRIWSGGPATATPGCSSPRVTLTSTTKRPQRVRADARGLSAHGFFAPR